ncbi:MAG: hypothetical protein BWY79_02226 [Actinobacteria bacterium ADurb.Bin444]|nr:MAG: hypothetical protein BWY79_02226 [Actinobacteria bacterium ADurb.Bin444]
MARSVRPSGRSLELGSDARPRGMTAALRGDRNRLIVRLASLSSGLGFKPPQAVFLDTAAWDFTQALS